MSCGERNEWNASEESDTSYLDQPPPGAVGACAAGWAGPQGNDSFRKVVINTPLTREGATKTLKDTSSINKRILLSMPCIKCFLC